MARTVELFGETFALNDAISEWALMEFAEATEAQAQDVGEAGTLEEKQARGARSMATLAGLKRLIDDCLAPEELKRFAACARKNRASSEQLMTVVAAISEVATDRPTMRPADSSDGPSVIVPKSAASSVDKGLEHFAGRPDLQLAVVRQRESMSA